MMLGERQTETEEGNSSQADTDNATKIRLECRPPTLDGRKETSYEETVFGEKLVIENSACKIKSKVLSFFFDTESSMSDPL